MSCASESNTRSHMLVEGRVVSGGISPAPSCAKPSAVPGGQCTEFENALTVRQGLDMDTASTLVRIIQDVVPDGGLEYTATLKAGAPIVFQFSKCSARIELQCAVRNSWVINTQYSVPYALSTAPSSTDGKLEVFTRRKTRVFRTPELTLFPVFVMILNEVFRADV